MTDTIKLLFTYTIAAIVIVGGGAILYATRLDGASDLSLVVSGFIGAAITFVFNRESSTQATRAAQSTAAATASQSTSGT